MTVKMDDKLRFKIVFLGSSKVGKTSLIKKFLYNQFQEKYKETIEDLHSKECTVKGINLQLDILDTNFNFPDMRRVAISSADAFVIVFGVDNVQSFKEMADLWAEISEKRPDFRQVPSVIVGNKGDTTAKKIYEATANAWTSRLNAKVKYTETSAMTGANVKSIFGSILELSGFPEGYAIPDGALRQCPPSRTNSQKEKLKKIKENEVTDSHKEENDLCEQISTGLSLPFDRIGVLKRNHSVRVFQLSRPKVDLSSSKDDDQVLKPKGSIIRRTKHLSLKLHKSDTSKIVQPTNNENEIMDCRIS